MSGRLVRPMTPHLTNERRGAGVPSPRQGSHVELWQLGGRWGVWCDGPERGTRWLVPVDDAARAVVDVLATESGAAVPVITRVFAPRGEVTAVLVKCGDIRAGVQFRGEA